MFKQARLVLTSWYLLILLSITVFFSIVIHNMLLRQVQGFVQDQRFRIERKFGPLSPPEALDSEFIDDAGRRIAVTLVFINGVIFFIAGGLSYFLAGKTLKPIQDMVSEQNRFISDSSHELRTPLTSLKSAIEVGLRDKGITLKDAKMLLSENLNDVNRLQLLSDNLLSLSTQKHLVKTETEIVDINKTIAQSLRNIENIAKNNNVTIENTANISAKVSGSSQNLSELFTLLLDNAIKYSHKGGKIVIKSESVSKCAKITIQDEGIGIAKKDLPHIFDRFFRSDAARSKRDSTGFGLGLSIAKKIVEDHGGTIAVFSRVGQGSTFEIKLPTINHL
ncbi:MAG: hypothetical protein UW80_C0027G0006 [Microgenomates group bacterium GW2011_GWC1_44_9]|nr:MAG: hypothetical protein UW80_C0027G0006 [Microgenomates group bacterium GW2011_GWC1_44_9]